MLKSASYDSKLKLLGLGVVFLCLVSWRFSVSKTLQEYSNYKQGKYLLEEFRNAPDKIERAQVLLEKMDRVLFSTKETEKEPDKILLDIITKYCGTTSAALTQFSLPTKQTRNDLEVTTHSFEVGGSYKDLLNLVYVLETKEKVGKLVSVKFYSLRNFQLRKQQMHLYINIQTFKKIDHEI